MVKDRLKQNGFVHNAVSGFSILELIVGIAIVGVLLTVVVPAFKNQNPQARRDIFYENMNALTREALIRALETGHPHRIVCNLAKKTVFLEEKKDEVTRDGEAVYERVQPRIGNVGEHIPITYEFQNFYVEGVDEIAKHGVGTQTEDVWFFVLPEGMCQEVLVNIIDLSQSKDGIPGFPFSLFLNPYQVQFEMTNELQRLP